LAQDPNIHLDACLEDWKSLLLPLKCILTYFSENEQESFQANVSVHNIKTGSKYHFYIPVTNRLYAEGQIMSQQTGGNHIVRTFMLGPLSTHHSGVQIKETYEWGLQHVLQDTEIH
jgi:hypothetical protein